MICSLWYVPCPMSCVSIVMKVLIRGQFGRRRLYQTSRLYKPISLFPPPSRSCWMLSVGERLTSSYATVLLTVSFFHHLLSCKTFVNSNIRRSARSDGCPRPRRLPPLPTPPRRTHALVNTHGTRRDSDFQNLSLSA